MPASRTVSDESLEHIIRQRAMAPRQHANPLQKLWARCCLSSAARWSTGGYKVSEQSISLAGPSDCCVAASSEADLLVTAGGSDLPVVQVHSASAGEVIHSFEGHTMSVRCVAISGDVIASAAGDEIRLWSLRTRLCIGVLEGHEGDVCGLDLVGDLLLSCSSDASIRLWSVSMTSCLEVLGGHVGAVHGVALGEGAAVSSGADGTARVWPLERGTARIVILLHEGADGAASPAVLSVSIDQDTVATGATDGLVRIWSHTRGTLTRSFQGHTAAVTCVRLHGALVVSGSADSTVRVWTLGGDGACVTSFSPNHRVFGVAHSLLGLIATVGGAANGDEKDRLILWRPMGS